MPESTKYISRTMNLATGILISARMQRPSFGHENQHFRENQAKTLVFIPNLAQRHR
jgi:hypothetical protein